MSNLYHLISDKMSPVHFNKRHLPFILADNFKLRSQNIILKCPSGFTFHFDTHDLSLSYMYYEQLFIGFVSSVLSEKERTIYKKYLRGEI